MSLISDVEKRATNIMAGNKHLRYGQALFEALATINQAAATAINGTEADPFYASKKDDPRVEKFFLFLMAKESEIAS